MYAAVLPDPEGVSQMGSGQQNRFPRTSLRNRDQVMPSPDGRDAVLLNGCGNCVLGQGDVLCHSRVEAGVLELLNRHNPDRSLLEHIDLGDAVGDVSWWFF